MFLSYVYSIRNKITGQFYFGSRCRNIFFKRIPENDFWVYYFTSSREVKDLIEKFGKDSFETTILHRDESYDNCYWIEQNLIKGNIENSKLLNRHYIDPSDGNRKFSTKDKLQTKETKEKISLSHRMRDPEKEYIRIEKQKITKANRTPEERKIHSERISKGRAAMSEEAKTERIRKQSEAMKRYHQNRRLMKLDK